MMTFIFMAMRNLRRHLRRTILTASSIAIGLAIVLWLQCILAGRSKNIVDTVTSSYSGYLQLYNSKYLEDKALQQTFKTIPPQTVHALGKQSKITHRVQLPSLISTGENSAPILLVGIEPENETQITRLKDYLKDGNFPIPDPDPTCPSRQIYIGKGMAKFLNAEIGSKAVILAQASDGTLGNELFKIVGTFQSKSAAFDKAIAFAPIACVKKVGIIDGNHEAVISLPDGTQIEDPSFIESITKTLPPEMKLTTWRETQPAVANLIRFNDLFFKIISTILYSVIVLGIINTMFMSVMERTREFGVMIAVGTTPKQLVTIVLLESLILGVISSLVGLCIGSIVVWYHSRMGFDISILTGNKYSVDQFSFDPLVYPVLSILPFLKTVFITVLFVMAAGFLPALRASRLKPVEAMSTH